MINWKRAVAALGAAALVLTNVGSVAQTTFAEENYSEEISSGEGGAYNENSDRESGNLTGEEGPTQDAEALIRALTEAGEAMVVEEGSDDGGSGSDNGSDDGSGEDSQSGGSGNESRDGSGDSSGDAQKGDSDVGSDEGDGDQNHDPDGRSGENDDPDDNAGDETGDDESTDDDTVTVPYTLTEDGHRLQSVETENYTVTVTYDEEALPDLAYLQVIEYDHDSETYQNLTAETGVQYDWLFDIGFYVDETENSDEVGDVTETKAEAEDVTDDEAEVKAADETAAVTAREIEPQTPVSISVVAAESAASEENAATVVTHFAEEGTEVLEDDDVEVTDTDDGGAEFSFELDSLSLVAGTTYHTTNVISSGSMTADQDYLIYKVSGSYVYFLVNNSGNAATFRVALSDLPTDGDGTPDLESIGSKGYYTDSIRGTVNGSTAVLNWNNLCWNYVNGIYLRSKAGNYYLAISSRLSLQTSSYYVYHQQGDSYQYTNLYRTNRGWTYNLGFSDNTFTAGTYDSWWGGTEAADVTIAAVGTDHDVPVITGGSQAPVYTGEISRLPLGFYSVCVATDDADNDYLAALPSVTYTFYAVDGDDDDDNDPEIGSITTSSEMRVDISDLGLTAGTYRMRMTAVPEGYVCDNQTWEFIITDDASTLNLHPAGSTAEEDMTGIIIVNPEGSLEMDKTAYVKTDGYADRLYQVRLTAHSDLQKAEIEAISVDFVVDQSNSMLFPAYLEDANDDNGNQLTLTVNASGSKNSKGLYTTWYADQSSLNQLSRDQIYYFVTEEASSSTNMCVWYNKSIGKWCYQDVSYYVKAYYANPNYDTYDASKLLTGDHNLTYPTNGYEGGLLGGTFDAQLDGSIYRDARDNHTDSSGNHVSSVTYQLYVASNEYNRLHYLEQSLSDMLQMLAAMNPDTEVTLDLFTNLDADQINEANNTCITRTLGTLYNGTSGLDVLLSRVGTITTVGGTRQDKALQHAYNRHQSSASDKQRYLILITDGAPAGSSYLGTATDTAGNPSNALSNSNTVYMLINYWANQIKAQGTTLATVGLSMRMVESGKKAMRYISTNGPSTSNYDEEADHGEWWYQPENTATLASILCEDILNSIVNIHKITDDKGTVVDYISESFYPVDENGNALSSGDWIDRNGNKVSAGSGSAAAQVLYSRQNGWYVQWRQADVGTTKETHTKEVTTSTWYKGYTRYYNSLGNSYYDRRTGRTYTWQTHDGTTAYWAEVQTTSYETVTEDVPVTFTGIVNLKAKEDLIGGNAIHTNRKATLSLASGGSYEYKRPTVNVRLLALNNNTSQVTVYKGDVINSGASSTEDAYNSPLGSMQAFAKDDITFRKLVSGTDGITNKVGAATATIPVGKDGFSLAYAIGRELTDAEWQSLVDALSDPGKPQSITIPYTYSDADGELGYFTIWLSQPESVTGQTAAWGTTYTDGSGSTVDHTADVARGVPNGENVETTSSYGDNWIERYTLHVTYTAYTLGEGDRPSSNQYNGEVYDEDGNVTTAGRPGTEVGGDDAGTTLETGLGTETSQNIHYVYAIDGTIEIHKELAQNLTSSSATTFTFQLERLGDDGENDSVVPVQQVGKDGYTYTTVTDRNGDAVTTQTITIPAGKTTTDASIAWTGLPRGTYRVVEVIDETKDKYAVESITVTDGTNCQASGTGTTEVIFTLGSDTTGNNVIGKAAGARYTSYTGTPNGVKGVALFRNRLDKYELPSTGGSGTLPVQLAGTAMVLAALALRAYALVAADRCRARTR